MKGGYKADLIEGCVFGRLISDLEFVSVSSPTTLERVQLCPRITFQFFNYIIPKNLILNNSREGTKHFVNTLHYRKCILVFLFCFFVS